MNIRRLATVSAGTLLLASGLAGCGSSSSADDAASGAASAASSSAGPSSAAPSSSAPSSAAPSSAPTAATTAMITITGYEYSGDTKVAPGARIMIKNLDSEAHTVTADSGGAFDVNVPPGKTVLLTAPSKAGAYAYHCTFHANMHGSLTVSG